MNILEHWVPPYSGGQLQKYSVPSAEFKQVLPLLHGLLLHGRAAVEPHVKDIFAFVYMSCYVMSLMTLGLVNK